MFAGVGKALMASRNFFAWPDPVVPHLESRELHHVLPELELVADEYKSRVVAYL